MIGAVLELPCCLLSESASSLAVRRHLHIGVNDNRQNKISLANTYSPNDSFHKPSAGSHSKTLVFNVVWRTQIPQMIVFLFFYAVRKQHEKNILMQTSALSDASEPRSALSSSLKADFVFM